MTDTKIHNKLHDLVGSAELKTIQGQEIVLKAK